MKPTHSDVPRVVELEARETQWSICPGQTVEGYGYNGQVPGPVIEARVGEPLEIRFTNRLPEPTLIHWHGLRVPAPMDGTQRETHHHDGPVKVGALQVWDVVNSSLMDHPFHLHGFFFQVLSINGEAPAFRSWEDVVNVPPRSTVRIAWMPDDRTGRWMYHCHILEHHEAGMMGHFEVVR